MNTPCLRWLVVLGGAVRLGGDRLLAERRLCDSRAGPAGGELARRQPTRGRSSSTAGRPADGECRPA